LIPSPNVAEDHQTKNAMALVRQDAAILVRDDQSKETLIPTTIDLLNNVQLCEQLSKSIRLLAKPNACMEIVDACESII
jgi:UDP-N-acetylglucosamine--N-acetylmuramyl-(pentapeptide) pyrophosphoryl-undecaprenol N-acetylglucosamine transferase